jgi:hypothetical protein
MIFNNNAGQSPQPSITTYDTAPQNGQSANTLASNSVKSTQPQGLPVTEEQMPKNPFNPKNCVFFLDLADASLMPRIMRYIAHHGGVLDLKITFSF